MTRPRAPVTVVISTRNRTEALGRCLASLAAGSVLPAEVVVVDQGDDAERVVRDAPPPLNARHVRHPAGGLAVAQNRGVAEARSAVVAVLDDDCEADDAWVETIARELRDGSPLEGLTGPVLPLGPPLPGTYPVASRTSTVRRDFSGKSSPWDVGSGNNFAVRVAAFREIGGCDPRLGPGSPGLGGVDMDLFYRLLRAGSRVRYEPAARVFHARTDRQGRLARRRPYGFGMGACCALWLRDGDRYALRVLASWLWLRGAIAARAVRRGRWSVLREELDVLRGTVAGMRYGLTVGAAERAEEPNAA